jgi:hypothetical protein
MATKREDLLNNKKFRYTTIIVGSLIHISLLALAFISVVLVGKTFITESGEINGLEPVINLALMGIFSLLICLNIYPILKRTFGSGLICYLITLMMAMLFVTDVLSVSDNRFNSIQSYITIGISLFGIVYALLMI